MRRAAILAILVCGCGGGTTGGGDGGGDGGNVDQAVSPDLTTPADMTSADQVASDMAMAFCARINACAPFYIQVAFGDVATCAQRFAIQLKPTFGLKGSSWTAAQVEQCVAALPNVSCDDLLTGAPPAPCAPLPGTLQNGAACGDDAQCMSGACVKTGGCGACGMPAMAGQSCAQIGCARGLYCGAVSKTCLAYGGANAACDADKKCVVSLVCKGTKQAGTCSLPLAADAACDPTADPNTGCDGTHGYYCNPFTKKCTLAGVANAGEACGLVNMGFTICGKAGTCRAGDGGFTGTCIAAAADGAMCDPQNGPGCMGPAYCAGVCKLFDPGTCM